MHQIEYLLDLAHLDDKKGRRSEASKMYSCAIEVALEAVSCHVLTVVLSVQWFGLFDDIL